MERKTQPNGKEIRARIRAIEYKQKTIDTILSHLPPVREAIERLFRDEKLRADQIAVRIDDDGTFEWESAVSDSTKRQVVEAVIRHVVDETTRNLIGRLHHAQAMKRREKEVGQGRDEWMREEGFFVWTDREKTHFAELLKLEEMHRGPKQLHHENLAKAMKKKFRRKFTPKITAQYYSRTKLKTDHVEHRRRERLRKANLPVEEGSKILQLSTDVRGEIDQTVTISPSTLQ